MASKQTDLPRRLVKGAAALAAVMLFAGGVAYTSGVIASEEGRALPAPAVDVTTSPGKQAVAVLSGGCFWGVQGVFQHTSGVANAVSGYAGGGKADAKYDVVSGGRTGHAEAVQIIYDPVRISYGQILQIFFSAAHDPTQMNRQGPDVGTQYRSAIFPQNQEQAKVAAAYIAQLDAARVFSSKIATKVEAGKAFFPAEAYHQDYLVRNPHQPYIAINDLPKVENLKRLFPALYRSEPKLVASR